MNKQQTYKESSFHVGWMGGTLVNDNSSLHYHPPSIVGVIT